MHFNISLVFVNSCVNLLVILRANKNHKMLHIGQTPNFSSSKHKNEFFKIQKNYVNMYSKNNFYINFTHNTVM